MDGSPQPVPAETGEDSDAEQGEEEQVEALELVEVDAISLKGALQERTLDGGVFAEPNTTRLLRENETGEKDVPVGIVANLDQELCGTNRCANSVVVASNTWIDNNEEVASRFNAAIEQSIQWILANELDYRAALVSCCALNTQDASDIPKPNFVGNDADFFSEVDPIIDVLVAQGKVTDRSRLNSSIIRVAE